MRESTGCPVTLQAGLDCARVNRESNHITGKARLCESQQGVQSHYRQGYTVRESTGCPVTLQAWLDCARVNRVSSHITGMATLCESQQGVQSHYRHG